MRYWQPLARGVLDLLYPGICLVCDRPASGADWRFCPHCLRGLAHDPGPACPRCAARVGPYARLQDGCPLCRNEGFAFESVRRLGEYEGVLRQAILRMKHQSGDLLADSLGRHWAEQMGTGLKALGPDVVLAVPLHWRRRILRGYNQSAVLAENLARAMEVPVANHWIRRFRATPLQSSVSPTERRTSMRQAFRVRTGSPVSGKSVLVVDDVLTTGSTAGAVARVLRQSGARRVVVAVLARATPNR